MSEPRQVAALFVRRDSIYKTMAGVDCWDEDRDALKWPGGCPIVAHPPCRLWGEMSHMSTAPLEEKQLAIFAVEQVRKYGGVLEHPAKSKLWPAMNLPNPGERDSFGGWMFAIPQFWWGHKARKNTRLYIVGIEPIDIPEVPLVLGEPEYVCCSTNRAAAARRRAAGVFRLKDREIPKSEREATPPAFAEWLIEVARRTASR